jgi:hypothetical protein
MKELVIAKYDRDYSWIKNINPEIKITVYKKGRQGLNPNEILIEPHVGRDVHTFFYHLYNRYDSLSDVTFFSQDYPFDHVSNYIDIINGDKSFWDLNARQHNDGGCWFFCTQYNILECDVNGVPHHPGLDLKTMWEKLFDSECPQTFYFTPTGHFAITKTQAHKIPRLYLKHVLDILENFPTSPWEIERLEPYIFLR